MNRLFLSWDKPACRAVAERLLSLGNDFHRNLVLVPTRESGRQLREYLASISSAQAIFAPQVIPADQFPRLEEKEETASVLEELAGWLQALGTSPHRLYPRLFPRHMPEDFSSMLEMAGSLQSLKHAMANQGISCGMAQDSCAGRDERWTDMDRLSEYCTQQLKGWQLADRTAMEAEAPPHLLHSLRETGGHVILACVADVPRPLRQALQHAERSGVPVQIWIHAPEEEAGSFDSWGCPLPEVWTQCPIHISDAQIRITANPARLAGETCRMVARTAEGTTPDVALGVCDPDMNVALDAALREYGWGLHNPEGKPFAGTGVMDLLRHLRQALEEKGAARPVFCLARSSLLCASLGIGNQQYCCAALDKIQQKFLPESEDYLISRLKEFYPAALPSIQAILAWRNRMAEPGTLGERLMEWFPALANAYGPETEAMEMLHSCLSGLIRLQQRSTACYFLFICPRKAHILITLRSSCYITQYKMNPAFFSFFSDKIFVFYYRQGKPPLQGNTMFNPGFFQFFNYRRQLFRRFTTWFVRNKRNPSFNTIFHNRWGFLINSKDIHKIKIFLLIQKLFIIRISWNSHFQTQFLSKTPIS